MIQELQEIQSAAGAIFQENSSLSIPMSFGNDAMALKAARETVAIYDRTHWGLLKVSGDDRLRFLHNQTTNDFNGLKPGVGCDTVFVTSTARTIDLVTAYVMEDSIYLLVSPNLSSQLLQWMDRYLFPMDKVKLEDVSSQYSVFSLIGSQSKALLAQFTTEDILNQPEYNHTEIEINETKFRIAVGNGLTIPGYTLLVPQENAGLIWDKLSKAGATPMGESIWEKLRILEGRPKCEQELTDDYNPLEAGLWKTISFEKGCYIGQETIARLNTYKGVKQRLLGIKLTGVAEKGTSITLDDKKIGILTSYTETDSGHFGLAYVKTKSGGVGLKVQVGEVEGELVEVPFLIHEYYE